MTEKFSAKEAYLNYDHIVVGSGIGGLTVANWLAEAGKKILVLESHYEAGGLSHTFKRKNNLKWDVGVHYVGNLGPEEGLIKLFDFLSDKKLKWNNIGEVYDEIRIENRIYRLPAGRENLIKKLTEYFPEEESNIIAYFNFVRTVNKSAQKFFFEKALPKFLSATLGGLLKRKFLKYASQSTEEVLKSFTSNEELQAVLSGQCGNYGLSPNHSSFCAHAIVIEHFMEGGYYPEGGSEVIAQTAIEKLNRNNGKVVINAPVQEIVIEENQVKGVLVKDKFIPCKSVISNVGFINTFNQLIKDKNSIYSDSIQKSKRSTGHICLYVGVDGDADSLNLPKNNIWSYSSNKFGELFDEANPQDVAKNFSYLSFPSAKDEAWNETNPNTSTIQMLTIGRHEWFEKFEDERWMKRGSEYEQLKENIQNQLLDSLLQMFPQLEGKIIHAELSTPLSTQHFTQYKKGEIYGLEHSYSRFENKLLRPKTKIKGLYLVGQDITIVGVAGAMLSGLLCATTILKGKTWKIFRSIAKD